MNNMPTYAEELAYKNLITASGNLGINLETLDVVIRNLNVGLKNLEANEHAMENAERFHQRVNMNSENNTKLLEKILETLERIEKKL